MEAEQQPDNKERSDRAYINPIVVKFNSIKPPKFIEKKDKEWIYYGAKNEYPYYLLSLYKNSAKHCALINGKAKYIHGKGWQINNKGLSANDQAIRRGALSSMNADGESLDDIFKKICLDYLIFRGYAIEVIWSKRGTEIAELRHVDWSNVRSNKEGDKYFYTEQWYTQNSGGKMVLNNDPDKADDFTIYEPFDPESKGTKQLFVYKGYFPGLKYYPLPDYMGIVAYIEIDIAISTFWNGLLKRGFSASHIINFYSGNPPTEEQRQATKEEIQKVYGGAFSDEAGGFVLNFASDKEHGSEVQTLSATDMDKQYDLLNKTTQQEIFTGHHITNGMLFGIKTEGQLGGRTELIESNELFQNVFVSPMQKEFENAFNYLLNYKGFSNSLQLGKLEPIGYMFGEAIVEKYLPAEAMRDIVAAKMGVDLTKYKQPQPVPINSTTTIQNRFSKQLKSDIFAKYGQSATDFEVIYKRPVISDRTLDDQEVELTAEYSAFAKDLSPLERSVLDLLSKDPLMDELTLSEVIKNIEPETIKAAIERLKKNGYLIEGAKKLGDEKVPKYSLTPKATAQLDKKPAPTEEIFVMYSYEWIPGFSDADLDTSRDFCKELIKLNRKYTRKDIDAMDNEMGLPVWASRGGWYTQPGTDIHIPQCRHEWFVSIVRKKS